MTAYTASNPVPLSALPTSSGVTQQFLVGSTNTGTSTFAPDGLAAAPIFGLAGAALQGGEIISGGIITLVSYVGSLLNGGSLCWVLFSCTGGAQQVGAATASQQAAQAGQVVSGVLNTATAGGTANAITASFSASPTSFSSGQPFTIIATATNTAAMTAVLTLGGTVQSSVSIVKGNNQALIAGDFPVGYPGEFAYSSAFGALVIKNPATGISSGVPTGTIIESAALSAPIGFLSCPTAQTNLSRTTYATLFAALTIQTVGTYANGATSITSVGSTTNMAVGYPISGAGIASGTTITAIGSGTLTISIATTAAGAAAAIVVAPWGVGDGSTTFGMPWFPTGYASVQANANLGTQTVGQVIAHSHTLGGAFDQGAASGGVIIGGLNQNTGITGGSANLAAGVYTNRFVKY